MKIMHLLAAGGTGGIETLCKNYAMYSAHDNTFVIIWGKDGATYLEMRKNGADVIQLNASKKRPLQTLRRIDAIRRERKIDTVVVHHGAPLSHLYLVLVKKKAGNHIWTITYAHGNAEVIYRIHDRRWRFLRKRVLKYTLQNNNFNKVCNMRPNFFAHLLSSWFSVFKCINVTLLKFLYLMMRVYPLCGNFTGR